MDKVQEYSKFRNAQLYLFNNIIGYSLAKYNTEIIKAAQKIGIGMKGKKVNFINERDFKYVMNYFLHKHHIGNDTIIDIYLKEKKINKEEEQIIEGIKTSNLSLYKVIHVSEKNNLVEFKDLLHHIPNKKITDIVLSKRIKKGKLIFTRTMDLKSLSITTDILDIFDIMMEEKLLFEFMKLKSSYTDKCSEEEALYKFFYTINNGTDIELKKILL